MADRRAGPPLVVTMGDACGIGPEIVARLFARGPASEAAGLAGATCVIGQRDVVRRAAAAVDPLLPVAVVDTPRDAAGVPPHCIPVFEPAGLPPDLIEAPVGRVDARAGRAAAACIEAAVAAVRAGQASAIVTAPIHKEALAAAGIGHPGHTEMLQALAVDAGQAPPAVRMMLANDELKVVLVTIHLSLREAIERVDRGRVRETIVIADRAARGWGVARPRVGVAGLNPHAGEGGLFGREEIEQIAPAVADAVALGIDARGPYAPDTVFMRARDAEGHRGEFDVVVAMTHDHGLIPVKYLGVEHGVNVTLGLPFVRTSPDHGTAFDIAGRGLADPSSLVAAVRMARRLLLSPARPSSAGDLRCA